ncbi:protein-glutamine gamma-glutamyltransferase [Sutcliffiella halmapala]|uniref:protein-glutamine gamma-glutamyltransferase n=1 Tax=Sutcliffiella halmapala TaxID=79882 RepID=UPI000994EA48|nr:protein-glutamine gamma-glutamyltransferase [Sutcliffiella halmapala]
MIQVAGRPLTQDSSMDFGGEENVVFRQMLNSAELFTFPSMYELQFDLTIRKFIMESAKEMEESEAEFTTFEYARCNDRYWRLTNAGGFQLKANVSPADAILDIYRNSSLYAFECATACVIIYYHALLKSIGKNYFDALFQNLYLYSWHTDPDLQLHTFYSNHYLSGDVVYFNNPDFHPNKPWFRGLNAVVMSDGTFFGHGFGIMTAEEIIEFLNSERSPGSRQPAYLSNIVTRVSPTTLNKLLTMQSGRAVGKTPKICVHHNLCSISNTQYQFYLNKFYR